MEGSPSSMETEREVPLSKRAECLADRVRSLGC